MNFSAKIPLSPMAKDPGVSATFRIIAVQTNIGYYIEKRYELQAVFELDRHIYTICPIEMIL